MRKSPDLQSDECVNNDTKVFSPGDPSLLSKVDL